MDINEVRRAIDLDEPDYPSLAQRLGVEALPQLRALVAEDEPRIASKAAYLASVISPDDSQGVVALASESRHSVVRIAAASALPQLDAGIAVPLARQLLADPDPGIRARAVRSASQIEHSVLQSELAQTVQQDPDEGVRSLAVGLQAPSESAAELKQTSAPAVASSRQDLLTKFRAAIAPEIGEIQAKGRQYFAEADSSSPTRLSIEIGVGDDPNHIEAANTSLDCWTEDVICGKGETGYLHCTVRVCMIIGPITESPG